jgi:hypothetical protein
MATVNLGSIKFKWKGTYAGGTAYTIDDVVSYNGSSYICILASTGNLPTNATYFEQMSSAGTNGTNGTDLGTTLTTQGDLVYRDGSGLQRLGAGTAGQALITGGAGANPSWGSAGGVVQVKSARQTGDESWSGDGVFVGPTATITPTSASNKILVMVQAVFSNSSNTATGSTGLKYGTGNTLNSGGTLVGGGSASGNRSQAIGWAGSTYETWNAMNLGYHILHNPATTSQISYRLFHQSHDGATAYLGRTGRDTNDADHGRFDTNITLMEIDAGVL